MKKAIIFLAIVVLTLCSCSQITQEEYDALLAERDQLKVEHAALVSDNAALVSDYSELQQAYDTLKAQTADWLKLSETEKAAQQANAEAEKIKAEEARRIAEEEKAAAEAQRQAELEAQRAAEEAARLEEEKKGYDTGITFDQLARTPDNFIGKKVKFKGRVIQVIEGGSEVNLRIATKKSSYGSYIDNVILVYYKTTIVDSRVLEDDIVTIYGVSQGLYTYDSTMGAKITVPLISVDRIDQ